MFRSTSNNSSNNKRTGRFSVEITNTFFCLVLPIQSANDCDKERKRKKKMRKRNGREEAEEGTCALGTVAERKIKLTCDGSMMITYTVCV